MPDLKADVKRLVKWGWHHRGPVPIPWRRSFGCWMLLYPDDQGIAIVRNEEGYLRSWAWQFLKEGMRVCDVGAGQGSYTILFAKGVGPTGAVTAFEPVVGEVKKLERNLRLNGLTDRVRIVPKAVGREYATSLKITIPKGQESRSSLGGYVPGRIEIVDMVCLDEWAGEGKIGLLKIDAEGGELDILLGAQRMLTKDRPYLIIEIADIALEGLGHTGKELVEFLRALKYTLWEPDGRGLRPLPERNWYETTVLGRPQ